MKCVLCGKRIEGEMAICCECLPEHKEEAKELEDIAAVLSITADTDSNIKRAMEGILNIAGRLQKKNTGEKKNGL